MPACTIIFKATDGVTILDGGGVVGHFQEFGDEYLETMYDSTNTNRTASCERKNLLLAWESRQRPQQKWFSDSHQGVSQYIPYKVRDSPMTGWSMEGR